MKINDGVRLDKIVLSNIKIDCINLDAAQAAGAEIEITSNTRMYMVESGVYFKSLKVHDDIVDNLQAGFSNATGEYCTMQLSVKKIMGTNLEGYSVKEYTDYLFDIKDHLKEKYGILISFDFAKLKKVEINRTFPIAEKFTHYIRPLKFIMQNLPRFKLQMPMNIKVGEKIETDAFYANTKKRNSKTSKDFTLFKIYDKGKQLERVISLEANYMRIEITLHGKAIKTALGTNKIIELTDDIISHYFITSMQNWIVSPGEKRKERNLQKVKSIIRQEKKNDAGNWIVNSIREIHTHETENNSVPFILSINEIFPILDEIEHDTKARWRIKQTFLSQAMKHERFLISGDAERYDEIIQKAVFDGSGEGTQKAV